MNSTMYSPVCRPTRIEAITAIPVTRDINIERNTDATIFVHHVIRYTNNQRMTGYTAWNAIAISKAQTAMNCTG